jgi:DNA-binding transcriptional MerR regulator
MTATVTDITSITGQKLPEGMLSTVQVCQRTGLTYRQIDYWTQTGLIPGCSGSVGSGTWRGFTEQQAEFASALAVLTRAGLSLRVAAEALADQISPDGDLPTVLNLAGGVTVTFIVPGVSATAKAMS